jgi:hypothetical protein
MSEEIKEATAEIGQELDELTQSILDRNTFQGAESVQEGKDVEKEVKSDGKGDEAQLEDDDVIEIDEPEAKKLEELGYDLENDLNGKTADEIIEIIQKEIKKDDAETASASQEQYVIKDSDVEGMGFLKNLAGKTVKEFMEEVGKSMKNQDQLIQQLQQQTKTKNETHNAKETYNFDIDEDFDFLTAESKEVQDYLDRRDAAKEKELTDKILSKLEPLLQPLQAQIRQTEQQEFYKFMQQGLPEGVKAEEAIQKWQAVTPLTQTEVDFYQGNPAIFRETIANWSSRNINPSGQKKATPIDKKATVIKIRKSIEQGNKSSSGRQYNSVGRGDLNRYSIDEDINDTVSRILKRHS